MDVVFVPLIRLLMTVISLYQFALIVYVILSWLEVFNIINRHNPFVSLIINMLYAITEPPLRIFRRFLPNLNGIDLSPLVLILALHFLQDMLGQILLKFSL